MKQENVILLKPKKRKRMIDLLDIYNPSEIEKLKLLPSRTKEGDFLGRQTITKYIQQGLIKPIKVREFEGKVLNKSFVQITGEELYRFAKDFYPPYILKKIKIKK